VGPFCALRSGDRPTGHNPKIGLTSVSATTRELSDVEVLSAISTISRFSVHLPNRSKDGENLSLAPCSPPPSQEGARQIATRRYGAKSKAKGPDIVSSTATNGNITTMKLLLPSEVDDSVEGQLHFFLLQKICQFGRGRQLKNLSAGEQ
jgi:hypothetical protein